MNSSPSPTTQSAARLVYKALQPNLSPAADTEYRELLALYRADVAFQRLTQEITTGFELMVLDVTERAMIVAPSSSDSRFAFRLADLRQSLDEKDKAALVLAHVAIAAVFFPTTEFLDDEDYVPPPASVAQFRDALYSVARHLKEASSTMDGLPGELRPGFDYIAGLAVMKPDERRAALTSIMGLVRLALRHMTANGLVRIERESDDETLASFTPTYRFRVQLHELTLRRLFDLSQRALVQASRGE